MAKNDQFCISLGERLRKSRLDRRRTAEWLAEAAGLCTAYVSEIECGKKCPGSRVLASLARSLETSSDYLLFGRPPGPALDLDGLSAAEAALLEQLLALLLPLVRAACRNG